MDALKPFLHLDIDWNLTPEDAVTLYLEWGNNDWQAEFPPVRSKSDVARYFVVDSWEDPPMIRLVQRNSETAEDLVAFPLPDCLLPGFRGENGNLRGISAPGAEIKAWLQKAMGQEKR
jgi:hypothetical protein